MNDIHDALKKIAAYPDARGVLIQVAATEGSSPRTAGARMVLGPDGAFSGTVGGGGLEYHAQREARTVLETGVPARRTYSLGEGPGEAVGAVCGGSAVLDFRPIGPEDAAALLADLTPPPRVLLYGSGHVGKALADILAVIGLAVTVTDERPELLTEERFPQAERRLLSLADAPVDAGTEDLVVITTHSHALDYTVLRRAMESPAAYIGMIGSRRKSALFRARLEDDGLAPEEIARRLRSPVGLSIGAETPEEIAVSIAAELIAVLRGREK